MPRKNGISPYAFIGFDCHYGQQPWLLATLENENQTYIVDIPSDTRVWLSPVVVERPVRKGNRGRTPTRQRVACDQPLPVCVREVDQQFDESAWQRQLVRNTEGGELWVKFLVLRVYPVRDELPGPETWLIIRIDESSGKMKYQLSNAPEKTSFEQLVEMSHSRFWMERAIEDAKGQAGLADYQLRSWQGLIIT